MIVPGSVNPLFGGDSNLITTPCGGVVEAAPSNGYKISNSLRFRGAGHRLANTSMAGAHRQKYTRAMWVKKAANVGGLVALFGLNSTHTNCWIGFLNDAIGLDVGTGQPGDGADRISTVLCRDPSAWYHLVFTVDTTQGNDADKVRAYINGVRVATPGGGFPPNYNTGMPDFTHFIGCGSNANPAWFNGYIADFHYIDGEGLNADAFGEFDPHNGVWRPKAYAGAYGNRGSHLKFDDTANAGKDSSGNNNHWIVEQIDTAAPGTQPTYDLMKDSPTPYDDGTPNPPGNYCTFNGANHYILGLGNGNLYAAKADNSLNKRGICGTLGPSSGKWYFEVDNMLSNNNECLHFGIVEASSSLEMLCTVAPAGYGSLYKVNGEQYVYSGGGPALVGTGVVFPRVDCVGAVAMDLDAGTLQYYMEGVATGPQLSIVVGSGLHYTPWIHFGGGDGHCSLNAGQRPFTHTPPAGFKALCTTNLPIPSITDGKKHFDIALGAGAGILAQAQALTPHDLIWIKDRQNNNNHQLIDVVRGANAFPSNSQAAEAPYVAPAGDSVAWAWKAGGAAVANTDGTISSQVSVNKCGGFSIVKFNGAPSQTVGHGLGVPPDFILVSRTSGGADRNTYWRHIGKDYTVVFNDVGYGAANFANYWGVAEPNATVFGTPPRPDLTAGDGSVVAYCFVGIPGFSAFGKYLPSTYGTFVYLGFTPKLLILKKMSSAGTDWAMKDSSRDAYNVAGYTILGNLPNAEYANNSLIDILSNGFKIRDANPNTNAGGQEYVYAAWAEHPFKIALAR